MVAAVQTRDFPPSDQILTDHGFFLPGGGLLLVVSGVEAALGVDSG